MSFFRYMSSKYNLNTLWLIFLCNKNAEIP